MRPSDDREGNIPDPWGGNSPARDLRATPTLELYFSHRAQAVLMVPIMKRQSRASRYHLLDPDPAPATIASFGMHVGEFSTRRREMFTLWGLVRTSNSCRGWGLGSWDLRKATLVPFHDELSYNVPNPGVFFRSTSMPIAIGGKDSRIELSLAPWLITTKPVFSQKIAISKVEFARRLSISEG